MSAVRKNKEHQKANETYNIVMGTDLDDNDVTTANRKIPGQMDNIIDIRYNQFICVCDLIVV